MRTALSLSRVELMTLKGRSPKHRGGSHRKNGAVLEALFETIDRSGRAESLSFLSVLWAGWPPDGLMALSPDGALPRSPF
jgi:hypothetical protein